MRHPIDMMSVGILKWGPQEVRFFTDGWGDDRLLHPPDLAGLPVAPLPIQWLTAEDRGDLIVSHGAFTSPVTQLPHRAGQGSVLRIEPSEPTNRVVVLMPAWNEHEPHVRVALAGRLAAQRITSIILENAYFGSRHPDPTEGHPIRTVADFMVMGESAVTEARGILAWLRDLGHDIGVSGYSMGGNTAALVSATLPFSVATAPLAAAYSPGPVFTEGVLRHGVSWNALGGVARSEELREVLGRVSVLNIPPQGHVAKAILVGAKSDAYIPRHTTEDLAAHWPGSELRWEPGGHATLVWYRKGRLTRVVVDAFDRQYPCSEPSISAHTESR